MTNLDSILKSRDITLPTQVRLVKAMVASNHVWLWELDHKESWVLTNWCFCTPVLEKTLESPLDCNEIQPVNSKGNQFWIFIGRTDAEAETPIHLTHWKRPWCWERLKAGGEGDDKGEMAGWHHRLNGHEFEQAPGVGDGQGSLASRSPWGPKSQTHLSDWTKLNLWSNNDSAKQLLILQQKISSG